MTERTPEKPKIYGPIFLKLNEWRTRQVCQRLALQGVYLPQASVAEYLSGMDPELMTDNVIFHLPEHTSGLLHKTSYGFTESEWLHGSSPEYDHAGGQIALDCMQGLKTARMNDSSVFRSLCILDYYRGKSIDQIVRETQQAMAEEVARASGCYEYDLPPAWVAAISRVHMVALLSEGQKLMEGYREDEDDDEFEETNRGIQEDAVKFLQANPDPHLFAVKLVGPDQLQQVIDSEKFKKLANELAEKALK